VALAVDVTVIAAQSAIADVNRDNIGIPPGYSALWRLFMCETVMRCGAESTPDLHCNKSLARISLSTIVMAEITGTSE